MALYAERRRQPELAAYEPIDETLAQPRVRILRALRWFAWVSTSDLLVALDVVDDDVTRARYRRVLHELVRADAVESSGLRYRIAAKGREVLAERIARAL